MSILPKQDFADQVISQPQQTIHTPPGPAAQTFNEPHPLETRVANWKANEEAFKMKLLQRTQGAAEPIKRTMETTIVEQSTYVPAVAGGSSNLHLDILKNNDASIDWEDIYKEEPASFDFHDELQKRMRI